MRAHVTGAEPPPQDICEQDKADVGSSSAEIVFPQNDEGSRDYFAEVSVNDLVAQAAAIRTAQPDVPVQLNIIGCLTYRSAGGATVHVTGFGSELGLADADTPAYDAVVGSDGPVDAKLTLTPVSAWAD